MSDITDQMPVNDPAEAGGQVDVGEQAVETVEPSVFADFDQYEDHLVPITVNGEEQFVPLKSLRDERMMHADYTRKSQELAEQRQALAQAEAIYAALQQDPERALELLREAYVAESQGVDETEFLTDEERRLAEIERRIAQQDRDAVAAQVEAELDGLVEQYGVDPDKLIAFAIQNNIPSLSNAYAVMAFHQSEAQRAADAERAAADERRTEAKRDAAVVSGGEGRNGSAAVPPSTGHKTIGSAFRAAAKQLGA